MAKRTRVLPYQVHLVDEGKRYLLTVGMINISIEYDCWNTRERIVGWQSIVLMLAWITVAGYYLHTKLATLHIT